MTVAQQFSFTIALRLRVETPIKQNPIVLLQEKKKKIKKELSGERFIVFLQIRY